ncbi:MAG TPA: hypothetical protein VIO35_09090 [Chloroflexota bacterium]|jgi:hypothetical protein
MVVDKHPTQKRKLYPRGGSFSLNLPVPWLNHHGIAGEVEIVDTPEGILVRKIKTEPPSIEDEPEFAEFLAFLAKDALAHPETLVDPDDLLVGVDALLEGVAPE